MRRRPFDAVLQRQLLAGHSVPEDMLPGIIGSRCSLSRGRVRIEEVRPLQIAEQSGVLPEAAIVLLPAHQLGHRLRVHVRVAEVEDLGLVLGVGEHLARLDSDQFLGLEADRQAVGEGRAHRREHEVEAMRVRVAVAHQAAIAPLQFCARVVAVLRATPVRETASRRYEGHARGPTCGRQAPSHRPGPCRCRCRWTARGQGARRTRVFRVFPRAARNESSRRDRARLPRAGARARAARLCSTKVFRP